MKKLVLIIAIMMAATVIGCRKEKSADEAAPQADTLQMLSGSLTQLTYPVSAGADASVDSMKISAPDSTLSLYVSVDDDLVDSAGFATDQALQAFAIGLLLENDTLKSILELAAHVPVNLQVVVSGREYALPVTFKIPAATFRTLRIELPDLRSRDELKVRNRVRFDNADCPFEIEDGVTLVSMSVQDRYVTFHTEIDVEKLDFMLMKENRDSLNVGVIESLKAQLADSTQRQSLLDIADARFGYRNRYVASDRRDSFDISFTPTDLIRLISVTDSLAAISHKAPNKM